MKRCAGYMIFNLISEQIIFDKGGSNPRRIKIRF